jgi:hypothetical protein
MSRKTLLDTYYTFTPGTRTVVLPRAIQREHLILITNVTSNIVIYNFSDNTLRATSYNVSTDNLGNNSTTIVLNYNTSSMSSTDKLQIVVDFFDETFMPAETLLDPVNKLRVSQPQSLIDTDFEYSTQATKWESLGMINNQPFAYYNVYGTLNVSDVQAVFGSRIYTVTSTNPPAVGTPVYILDTLYIGADGLYIVDSNTATSFSYTGRIYFTGTTGSILNAGVTAIYQGYVFSGSQMLLSNIVYNGNAITVFTQQPHNMALGNEIALVGTYATTNPPNGSWTVATIPNAFAFTFYANSTPTGTVSIYANTNVTYTANSNVTTVSSSTGLTQGMYVTGAAQLTNNTLISNVNGTTITLNNNVVSSGSTVATVFQAVMYPRPQGTTLHRSFDGGVRFSTNGQSHNLQYIRQTRRYFRYQSGKAIQMTSGVTLKPILNIVGMTSSGTTITVTCVEPHNMQTGIYVLISKANETAYNGIFAISAVLDPYKFQYIANTAPTASPASGLYQCSAYSWYGNSNRMGIFDNTNGMFFEFDGQTLYVVRRASIYQISGLISVNAGSSLVNGLTVNGATTSFSKQLSPNDFITIKGMSYRVTNIVSDTQLYISPAYRGSTNLSNAVLTRTIDVKTPQSQWNLDRCDGTGPSGYNLDLTKMQMWYIDYSWYGAGFIRFGLRAADGNIIYVHKVPNNNIQYQAYMRSGNLPGRYEANTFTKTAILTQSLGTTDTIVNVSSTDGWPTSGTVWIHNINQSEYCTYTGLGQLNQIQMTTTIGLTTISAPNGVGTVNPGQYVSGTGIQPGSYVVTVGSNYIVVNYPATFSNTTTLNFAPYISGLIRGQAGATVTGTTSTSSNTITGITNTNGIQVGQYVTGTGIPPNAFVISINQNVSVTLSVAAIASGTVSIIFAPMGQTAQAFTYSATNPTAIELHSPSYASELNHWGTAATMDGRFDSDAAFIFTKGMTSAITINGGASNAVMSFRISPSASNGIPGSSLGVREITLRMQMVMDQLDLYSNGAFLLQMVLNGIPSIPNPQWQPVGGSSLAQYIFHYSGTTVAQGEPIFGFFLNTQSSGGSVYTATSQDLTGVRDLGTSILSGGSAYPTTGVYPDGPDVITIVATNIGASASQIYGRMSWKEAQA